MNLDKLTVNIKPLSAYQAIDLGIAMARAWYVPLWKIWCKHAVFVLILALAFAFFIADQEETWWVAAVLFWWLKPIYEKPMLIYLSRKLFDEHYNRNQVAMDAKKMPSVFYFLIWRLGFLRIIAMSVRLLEGQTAKNATTRINVLTRKQNSAISLYVLLFFVGEMVTLFACWQLFHEWFLDNTLFSDWLFSVDADGRWLSAFWVLCYGMISSILAPFYVASGFSVYLCKRSLLEGWDIELMFYKLRHRYLALKDGPNRGMHQ